MTSNPYGAPTNTLQTDPVAPVRLMSWSTIRFVFAVGLVAAIIGMCGGWLVGTFAPQYYETIFNSIGAQAFNPVRFGLTIGAMQGFSAGTILGTVLAALQAWFEDRRFNRQQNHIG